MFANNYLEKNSRRALIETKPPTSLGLIVVIPCYFEPDIIKTLDSLVKCQPPKSNVEVIILINHSEIADQKIKIFNQNTKFEIENWIHNNNNYKIRFYAVGPVELQKKWAGAGLARKAGMDEAVLHFNTLNKPEGIIVSLDADTLVDENYMEEIENYFEINKKQIGATISFKHQTDNLDTKHLEGIQLYEQYMNYFKNALEFTGYPYAMFTVGSAFAVKAGAYVKRGGMNRRQAGEDFYFLQNLAQQGEIGEILTTKVYPSARLSDRVPFGTGTVLRKWMNDEEDLHKTYNFKAFRDLRQLFQLKERFFRVEKSSFDFLMTKFPEPIQKFIMMDNFWKELEDLNRNCSNLQTFQNRFFHKFNAFKIIRFLNFSHEDFYKKEDIKKQIQLLENH